VAYRDALALQHRLFEAQDDWLLLLEHPHVFTLGARGDLAHVLVDPASVRAESVRTDRGGDVTYHGPGQLVGYPILTVPGKRGGGMADTVAYVSGVEQLLIDVLGDLGLASAGRLAGYPGVWIDPEGDDPRKIAAIGVRLARGRSMHGFALNVDPDMSYFSHIVPCGIEDKAVTSLVTEGVDVSMKQVVDALVARFVERQSSRRSWSRADVAWKVPTDDVAPFTRDHATTTTQTAVRLQRRLDDAGVHEAVAIAERKPPWLRARLETSPEFLELKKTMRDLDLRTVCEEAGCPNIFECWDDGTATFMLNGERCTRACGFCLVDTRHPDPLDPDEPARVADAVDRMGLEFAVLTAVARDDLPDGGAGGFAATMHAIRARRPSIGIEVLIPDCKGDDDALETIFSARPDVLNHNVETVPRLQRAVRPSASYARSLSVLARAVDAGLTAKSGLIVGLGESRDEVAAVLADLAGVGVEIVTIGQYLRPTARHLPVARWWRPEEFEELAAIGRALGLAHVEASPFTRSSYHARQAASAAEAVLVEIGGLRQSGDGPHA
jgi:lipoic acid synthetase